MYVLHAHWHHPVTPEEKPGMLLWAETSDVPPPTKSSSKRGKKAGSHPFCAAPETVEIVLHPVIPELGHNQLNWLRLLLPSSRVMPLPSPELLHNWDTDTTSPQILTSWIIAGLWLSPEAAFDCLSQLPSPNDLPSGLALGQDILYWQRVTNLLLETLAQQKMLPGLIQVDQNSSWYEARWTPVLDGPQDGPHLAQLREMMPPICRAEAETADEALHPQILLDSFLNSTADAVFRRWGETYTATFYRQDDIPYRWLEALFAINPKIDGSPAQLQNLYQNHQNWLRNLHLAGDKNYRVAFRLEAPTQQAETPDEANWRLHYLLQARDDPSLLIAAQQVWQTQGNVLNALNHRFDRPQEKLLAGLGYAANLYPLLRQGLQTGQPTGQHLTTEEAFDFLREYAALLEASGFGVLVPPWWNKPGARLGAKLKMSAGSDNVGGGEMGFNNLIQYQWELALGDTALTREEFEALVALKSPLVNIRGQWVQLNTEQVEAAIQFWQKQSLEDEVSLQEAMQMGLGATDTAQGLPVEQVEFEGWLKDWMEKFTGNEKLGLLEAPKNLQAQLRPYQEYGYAWLDFLRRWGLGACLADDMGLGKTIQTIAMLQHEKEVHKVLPAPTLIICPTSVVVNWAKEIERFAPTLTTVIHQGQSRLRDDKFLEKAQQVDIVLSSYAIVRRDIETLQKITWYGLILDEAQNIKNPDAQQTQAIRKLKATFRVALTGTPVENRLGELWSIMNFLNPGFLGSRNKFRQRFARPIERYGDTQATEQLKNMVSPFILRRIKSDPDVIQDLPEKQEMKVYCNMSEEQVTLYEAVVRNALQEISETSGIQRKGIVLSMLMKLKQICNHPAQFLHQMGDEQSNDPYRESSRSGKLARLTEMLSETLSVNDRSLIFTQFSSMGHFLKAHLQQTLGVPVQFLHGGTPAEKRAVMVDRFQQDDDAPPIFILSLKAGGTGLNLTRANHVFHFDRWWNPAVEDQATDRAYRIGQSRNVQVHKFVCVGTLEERIDTMIESKKALAASVIGGGENWLTELSTNDLRDLVTLQREAVL